MQIIWKKFPYKSLIFCLGITLSQVYFGSIEITQAQISTTGSSSEPPLDLKLLNSPNLPNGIFTSKVINQDGLTSPSLWWIKDNFETKLMDNWIAYSQIKRVDVVVNQQFWSIFGYLERYNFINRVGANARIFGYNTRVFNYQQELLGTYTCNFPNNIALKNNSQPKSSDNLNCRIVMNTQNRLGVESTEKVETE
jgi:hypothetical protein